jgi:hypothetical protein
MPTFEFPYLGFQIAPSDPFPKGQVAFRPMAVAELTASTGKRLRCLVCTDSGADSCVFPSSFASVLGLDILTMKKHLTSGVGSSANSTACCDLHIDLGRGIQFTTYAGFTPGLDSTGFGHLGQAGFFDRYNVSFFQAPAQIHN